MTIADIYDYFTPIEAAIVQVFDAQEIVCWTPLRDPEFQKQRPRVEAVLMPGAGKVRLLPQAGRRSAPGHLREQARNASLVINVITEANITLHRAYVARVIYLLDTMAHDAQATGLIPNHFIAALRCNGGQLDYKPEEGLFNSTLNCDLDFSVRTTAWAELAT